MEPILKWAGGKRKLIGFILELIDLKDLKKHKLYEPFVGGGSFSFLIANNKLLINDINSELFNLYCVVRDNPNGLIKELKRHKKMHCKEYYYKIRNLDREEKYLKMSNVKKAARIIYLNRTCFNGLYRVNSKGYFNVPIGRYLNPDIVMEERIIELSNYFNNNSVEITNSDFSISVESAKKGDYVYFDPPYDYESNGFVSYSSCGFTHDDLVRLKDVCVSLIKRGVHVIVSNNDTKFVQDTFSDKNIFKIKKIKVQRHIGASKNSRKKVDEVIIYG